MVDENLSYSQNKAKVEKNLKMSEEVIVSEPTRDTEEQQQANGQLQREGGMQPYESHVLFDMKGSSRREWKYVRLVAKEEHRRKEDLKSSDASKAYCTLCTRYITYTKGNGNSVYRHMEKFHRKEMDQAECKQPMKKQKTLVGHFSNIVKEQNLRLASRDDRLLGDALLVKWTSKSLRPFKIVEDSGFKDFCMFLNQLRSRYEIPSRTKHRNQMMKIAECVMNGVKETIASEMTYYSMTFDIWSSRVMQSFMGVTLHYLTDNFQVRFLNCILLFFKLTSTLVLDEKFCDRSHSLKR